MISPNLAIPEPCKSALIHRWPFHSQCPKVRARVSWWHTVISDLKTEYHNVSDPTADRAWLRLSRLRDNETKTHRDSEAPSCDDLFEMFEVNGGENGQFYGSDKRQLWHKKGAMRTIIENDRTEMCVWMLCFSRWVGWLPCCKPGRETGSSICRAFWGGKRLNGKR